MQKLNVKLPPLIRLVALVPGAGYLDNNGFIHFTPVANCYGTANDEMFDCARLAA